MFPLQGGCKKVNHSLSWVLGPHMPDSVFKNQPQWTLVPIAPIFGDLWNNTYFDWTLPWIPL